MKRRTEAQRQRRARALWFRILTAGLPVLALALAAAVIFVCVVYSHIRPVVTIELGEETPDAKAFLRDETDEAAYAAAPEAIYKTVGDYRLKLIRNGIGCPVLLRVRDTQAPTAQGTETTISTLQSPTPDRLIRNLRDQSIVKVTFETAPEYGTIGDYDAVVLLEDAGGNQSRVPVTVHIRAALDAVICEAGEPAPTADAFLIDAYTDVQMSEITDAMMTVPGTYTVHITADGCACESELVVRDTVAPTAKPVTYIAALGDPVTPEMLVGDIEDATFVTASFVNEPDPDSLSAQTIAILLTDRGGNETVITSTLLFSNIAPLAIEARNEPLTAEELLTDVTYTEASLPGMYIPNAPGLHVIPVTVDGRDNLALIEVVDTTPPEIILQSATAYLYTPQPVETFASVWDVTETTYGFVREPDWTKEAQEVTVWATDAGGNRSELTFPMTLIADIKPPKLYGVHDRYCYVGEAVAYFAEVSAWDNCDGAVEVTVDASRVDDSRKGEYPVTYSATDRAGNTAEKTVTFCFVEAAVTEAYAKEVADKVLAEILTDDMTLAEQIEAIYNYVYNHVRYVERSNKKDWRSEAVRGLTAGQGDCFTSYSAARLLLEQTDAQIVSVERSGGRTHHYWMLVNIGTGWYHYDACRSFSGKYRCFMWTTAQTRRISDIYWKFDETLYPPVATERYNGGN